MKKHLLLSLTPLMLVMAGCGTLTSDKIDYKNASKAPSLEIPPDLTQLPTITPFAPGNRASAVSGQRTAISDAVAPSKLGDVRIEQLGTSRLLVVKRSPDQLWPQLKEFWREVGMNVVLEQPQLGVMETDWSENRAKLPQDWIRRNLGGLLDGLYASGEQDKYKLSIERRSELESEIRIAHKGLIEVFNTNEKTSTTWQSRPADSGLENEMLRRLMVKLGGTNEQAQAALLEANPTAQVAMGNSTAIRPLENRTGSQMEIKDDFDRAWRRVGLALDRSGFVVEDRDRAKGVYLVRFTSSNKTAESNSFWTRLISSSKPLISTQKFAIQLQANPPVVIITATPEAGSSATADETEKVLKVLAADLN